MIDRDVREAIPGKLYISNLPVDAEEKQIEQIFSKYGRVVEVRVIREKDSDTCKGFAFLTYNDPEDCSTAIHGLDGTDMNGHSIRVEQASKRVGGSDRGGYRGGMRGRGRGGFRGGPRGRGGMGSSMRDSRDSRGPPRDSRGPPRDSRGPPRDSMRDRSDTDYSGGRGDYGSRNSYSSRDNYSSRDSYAPRDSYTTRDSYAPRESRDYIPAGSQSYARDGGRDSRDYLRDHYTRDSRESYPSASSRDGRDYGESVREYSRESRGYSSRDAGTRDYASASTRESFRDSGREYTSSRGYGSDYDRGGYSAASSRDYVTERDRDYSGSRGGYGGPSERDYGSHGAGFRSDLNGSSRDYGSSRDMGAASRSSYEARDSRDNGSRGQERGYESYSSRMPSSYDRVQGGLFPAALSGAISLCFMAPPSHAAGAAPERRRDMDSRRPPARDEPPMKRPRGDYSPRSDVPRSSDSRSFSSRGGGFRGGRGGPMRGGRGMGRGGPPSRH